jgi:hypothetical protein
MAGAPAPVNEEIQLSFCNHRSLKARGGDHEFSDTPR